MSEIYFSTDIEANGPIPGPFSMLSLGSVAFDGETHQQISSFMVNIEELPLAGMHPETMAWWSKHEKAYAATRINMLKPDSAMMRFDAWVRSFEHRGKPVFVGYPAGFDFLFVYWYLIQFLRKSPFSFSALDMKTYAMATIGTEYRETTKKTMPKEWFKGGTKHSHLALEDAAEQGELFMNMLRANLELRTTRGV